MPKAGEESVKFGIGYEDLWTIKQLCQLLEGDINRITLAPHGEEGEGIEFNFQDKNGQIEHHQVKRQTQQRWTFSTLGKKYDIAGEPPKPYIIQRFEKIIDSSPENICRFVSSDRAQELDELSENARKTDDFNYFYNQILSSEQSRKKKSKSTSQKQLEELCQLLLLHPKESTDEQKLVYTFNFLKRIYVDTISERNLEKEVEIRLRYLIDSSNLSVVSSTFSKIILRHTGKKPLTAALLWQILEKEYGLKPRNYVGNKSIYQDIVDINAGTLASLNYKINDQTYPQSIVENIVSELSPEVDTQIIFIEGQGGAGKSEVFGQVLSHILEASIPALGMRLSRTQEIRVHQVKDLGTRLYGLPESPDLVLSNFVEKEFCVVLWDQLDAVSQAGGRNQEVFPIIHYSIESMLNHGFNIKYVLVCRKIDLQTDSRFIKLAKDYKTRTFSVNGFNAQQIDQVIHDSGGYQGRLSEEQYKILSSPFLLNIFVKNILNNRNYFFGDINDLMRRYFHDIDTTLSRDHQISIFHALHNLIELMIKHKTKEVHNYSLFENRGAIDRLISQGVLSLSQENKVSFTQDSYYDFFFGRYFCETPERNIFLYFDRYGQDISDRGLLLQLLQTRRKLGQPEYYDELKRLLTEDQICVFIKDVVFNFLRTIDEHVFPNEWQVLMSVMSMNYLPIPMVKKEYYFSRSWSILIVSDPWYKRAHDLGFIQYWLFSKEESTVKKTILMLANAHEKHPQQVAQYMNDFFTSTSSFRILALDFFYRFDPSKSEDSFRIFINAINEGFFETDSNSKDSLWTPLTRLMELSPKKALVSILAYLRYHYKKSIEMEVYDPFKKTDGFDQQNDRKQHLRKIAKRIPEEFLLEASKFILEIIKNFKSSSPHEVTPNWNNAGFVLYIERREHYLTWPEEFYLSLLEALKAVLHRPNKDLNLILNELEKKESEFFDHLLIEAYSHQPQNYSIRAVKLIIRLLHRWQSIENSEGIRFLRDVIGIISNSIGKQRLISLAKACLQFEPNKRYLESLSKRDVMSREEIQSLKYIHSYFLLMSIPQEQRPDFVVEWLKQKESIVNKSEIEEFYEKPRFTSLKSPISIEESKELTVDDWSKLIRQHHISERLVITPGPTDCASQLSRTLVDSLGDTPEKIVDLFKDLHADTNPTYWIKAIESISKSDISFNDYLSFCEIGLTKHYYELAPVICRTLAEKLEFEVLPNIWLEHIFWFASYGKNIKVPELHISTEDKYLDISENTLQGQALHVLEQVLHYHADTDGKILNYLERITQTQSAVTWSLLVAPIAQIKDTDKAVELLLRILNVNDDGVLASRHVVNVVNHFRFRYPEKIGSVLLRMFQSSDSKCQKNGAKLITASYVTHGQFSMLFENEWKNNFQHSSQKLGVCSAVSHLVWMPKYFSICEPILMSLINDGDLVVRKKASSFLRNKQHSESEAPVEIYRSLLSAVLNNEAIQDNDVLNTIFWFVKKNDIPEDLLCEIVEKLLYEKSVNVHHYNISDFMNKVMQIHEQTVFKSIKERSLKLIDRALLLDNYGINRLLG